MTVASYLSISELVELLLALLDLGLRDLKTMKKFNVEKKNTNIRAFFFFFFF